MDANWTMGLGFVLGLSGCWEESAPASDVAQCPQGPEVDMPSCWEVPVDGVGSINIDGEITHLKVTPEGGGGQIVPSEDGQLLDITLAAVAGESGLHSVWLMAIIQDGSVVGLDAQFVFDGGQFSDWSYAPEMDDWGQAQGFDFSPETVSPTRFAGRFGGELLGGPGAPQDALDVRGKIDVCVYECVWPTEQ